MPELGHFSLVLAGCLALYGVWVGLTKPADTAFARSLYSSVLGQFVFATVAFLALVYSFVVDDFSDVYGIVVHHVNGERDEF